MNCSQEAQRIIETVTVYAQAENTGALQLFLAEVLEKNGKKSAYCIFYTPGNNPQRSAAREVIVTAFNVNDHH